MTSLFLFNHNAVEENTLAMGSARPLTEMSKGKAVPLQAWSGPEGSRKLRFPDFKIIDT